MGGAGEVGFEELEEGGVGVAGLVVGVGGHFDVHDVPAAEVPVGVGPAPLFVEVDLVAEEVEDAGA